MRDHLQTINSEFGRRDRSAPVVDPSVFRVARISCPSRARGMAGFFAWPARADRKGFVDTGWAPRVTAAEREHFEQDVRANGFPDFQIVERGADGKMVRATDRGEYFPILYSDPGAINRPVMGFDLASEGMRESVIARARATDRPAATPPLRLMNMQRPNGGLMSFIPVHAKAADDRGENLTTNRWDRARRV